MFLVAIFLAWCTAISCAHGAEGKAHGFIVVNSFLLFIFSLRTCMSIVVLSPTDKLNVTVCLGTLVTFTCRTTGGALLWEPNGFSPEFLQLVVHMHN